MQVILALEVILALQDQRYITHNTSDSFEFNACMSVVNTKCWFFYRRVILADLDSAILDQGHLRYRNELNLYMYWKKCQFSEL